MEKHHSSPAPVRSTDGDAVEVGLMGRRAAPADTDLLAEGVGGGLNFTHLDIGGGPYDDRR